MSVAPLEEIFADEVDYDVCRRLHKQYGTTYYFASRRFNPTHRRRTDALYGFVRTPDEWVDNPGKLLHSEVARKLEDYRGDMLRGFEGIRPFCPELRAFCDVARECAIPLDEPLYFLEAMRRDLIQTRYLTFGDLLEYTRGSAAAIAVMMVYIVDGPRDEKTLQAARTLGDAMQLTNFLRDVGEDSRRGRIYLPLEDLANFGVKEEDILEGNLTPQFKNLMKFEIERTRALYASALPAIGNLPREARLAVGLAAELYSRILARIEARAYDVFSGRARTSRLEKIAVAARYAFRK